MTKPVGLLYTGNSLEVLKSMEEGSVQCCVTSPPYWGLRDYGICSCRQGRMQHESSTLVGSQAGTPSEFGAANSECEKCNGTGRLTSTDHIWGGDSNCQHTWISIPVKGQSGGLSDKQKSIRGSHFAPSTCSTCSAWFGSLGLEPTPELYIEHLVIIFREVFRVLRDDGTLWVNIGDTYAGGGRGGNPAESKHRKQATNYGSVTGFAKEKQAIPDGVKPKDLIGIPWMLAFALRDPFYSGKMPTLIEPGFYLRQDIIWSKRNCLPESVTDRCVKSHEYVFLLSKSRDYYFDHIAIREPAVEYAKGKRSVSLGSKSLSRGQATGANVNPSGNAFADSVELSPVRNKRSVWTLASKPFSGGHFACFPPDLVEPMIKAATSEYGCCASCGAPYERIIEKSVQNMSNAAIAGTEIEGKGHPTDQVREDHDIRDGPVTSMKTVGWKKSCKCVTPEVCPCVVLDPFSGAATTGLVALSLARNYIGIETNPQYQEIAKKRLLDARLDCEIL